MRILLLLSVLISLTGCYYMQAASGQWEVIRKRRPVEDVIADPKTSPKLAAQLHLLREARDFSIEDLGLPDNKSYRTYSALQRKYVVWNVFAAPEFSLDPKKWCFPVAGCVSYRGYFSKDKAVRESLRLERNGYDVAVGGIAAYSTLGNFSDPLLSTMMHWEDVRLVAVLFHELAHQVVYIKGDTAFNESFATAVEEYGVRGWLASRGQADQLASYRQQRELERSTLRLVDAARQDLATIFAATVDNKQKRARKLDRLARLSTDVTATLQAAGRDPVGWFSGSLNNAHLISQVLYEGRLLSFRAIFRGCNDDIQCFYTAVDEIASLDPGAREAALDELESRP